ncbi:MAG: rod shape-determining protein MreC [Lentisphaeria bacterium]|nr:rod shape-determining protein MreC [Lentisphaeria bacterium]
MKKFPAKSKSNPKLVLVVTLVILSIVIMLTAGFNVVRYAFARFADGFFYPYMKLGTPSAKLTDPALLMADKHELAARVEKLTNTNRELALQGQSAAALMEENRKLRTMLTLREKTSPRYTVAGIILRDPLHFSAGFTIDKGSRDGIVSGAAVVDINDHGQLLLVGVVSEVGARTAKVTTIANPSLRLSGEVSSNRMVGFINAGEAAPENGNIRFGMLPPRDDYIRGNIVTTTGFERGIPPGIKIGELHTGNFGHAHDQEDFSCELLPSVRFESLRFVAVVLLAAAPEELK